MKPVVTDKKPVKDKPIMDSGSKSRGSGKSYLGVEISSALATPQRFHLVVVKLRMPIMVIIDQFTSTNTSDNYTNACSYEGFIFKFTLLPIFLVIDTINYFLTCH
ncbi:hypothetical protein AAZX31_02G086800 [Glycine max]